MAVKKSYMKSRAEYTVSYRAMRGVDFSSEGSGSSQSRFSYLENMYRDYDSGGSEITESIPGFRKIAAFRGRIHSIFSHKNLDGEEFAVVHAGSSLYRFSLADPELVTPPPSIASVKDGKSRAFNSGSNLYVIDGENITRISSDGIAAKVGDEGEAAPYVPTVYVNGEEFEQRNLLTDKFRERYTIGASRDFAAGSDGLKFNITSSENLTCSAVGIDEGYSGPLNIPSFVYIAGVSYKVTEIADNAFSMNTGITSIILSDSVKRIGSLAFSGCTAVTEVITKDSLEEIANNAFLGCTALKKIFIGAGVTKIGAGAFGSCSSLKFVDYALDAASFSSIDNQENLSNTIINYGATYIKAWVEIPIFSPAKEIISVTIDGQEMLYTEKFKDGLITAIVLNANDSRELDGGNVIVLGLADPSKFTKNSIGTNFIAEEGAYINGKDAILGCRVCECFDGRVFLSGNEKLPNTVFYSSRDDTGRNNPLYFGILNYFSDGTGNFTVESMLAAGESLAVFKSGDDGGGSIYYHTPRETGVEILPKIYPATYIHSGICAVGDSISFFDDPIFISALGVTALDKRKINLERSVAVRSHNVNARLLGENTAQISMTVWCGYLVVMAGEHIYLADSRQTFTHKSGSAEYEWYYLSGIGTYRGESKVFRYSETAKEGYTAHPNADAVIEEKVYMSLLEDGSTVYYTNENGIKYEAYTLGEAVGGIFSPASCVYGTKKNLLLFGTESGDVCVFNNDKRGKPPPWIESAEDYNAEEYARDFGRKIHPYYYSFASHAPRYALSTAKDNGGFPNLTKNTVKNSLAVKVKLFGSGGFTFEVANEKNGYREIARLPAAALDFSELDFSALSFSNTESMTVPLKEREKGWIEKEMSFYSDEYSSPFGIYSVTFRFAIKGKIKN